MGDDLAAELKDLEQQLADVNASLQSSPGDAELLGLRSELEDMVKLTRDLLLEQQGQQSKQPAQSVAPSALSVAAQPPPPPPPAGPKNPVLAQMASTLGGPRELWGWKVGDTCRTVWLGDGKQYEATVLRFEEKTKSVVIRFKGYGNDQNTPVEFLQRVEDAAAGEGKGDADAAGKKKRERDNAPIEILPTDPPHVVKRKKKLLKQQKREVKQQEKEKESNEKKNSWKSFQESEAKKRGPASTGSALTYKPPPPPVPEAVGVRKKWTGSFANAKQEEEDE